MLAATGALTASLAACNALIGLDGDYELAGPTPPDATVEGAGEAGDAVTEAPADAGRGEYDGDYKGCWDERENITLTAHLDNPAWKVPNPRGIPGARNAASYTASPGVVHDNVTGLDWVMEDDAGAPMTFAAAEAHCVALGARLPERIELVTVQDWLRYADGGPVNALEPLSDHAPGETFFWTRSPYQPNQGQRWVANFELGFGVSQANRTDSYQAKCVRTGDAGTTATGGETSRACKFLRDERTHLEWDLVTAGPLPFAAAVLHCNDINTRFPLSTTPDRWRLPTYAEILSLVDSQAASPALVATLAQGTPKGGKYWTSSFAGGNPSEHLALEIDDGSTSTTLSDAQQGFVRCVHEFDPTFPERKK